MTEVPSSDTPQPTPTPVPDVPTRPPADPFIWATGRRKTAVARVRIRRGNGVIQANGRDLNVNAVHLPQGFEMEFPGKPGADQTYAYRLHR